MGVDIIRLTAADAAVLDRVAEDVFDAPVDPVRLAAYLADPANLLFVAVCDGVVVGQTMGVVHRHPDKPDDLFIDNVGVSPAFQRRSVARRMMEAAFAQARSLGCDCVWVSTEVDNGPARALYESLGATGQTVVMYEYEQPTGA